MILLLTALLVIGRLRLGAVCRLLTRRAPEKHLEETVLARLGRLGRDPCGPRTVDAAACFPRRFGVLGFLHNRRILLRLRLHLRRDGLQFDRRRVANLDRDADDGRLDRRSGFFRIGVSPVAGEPATFSDNSSERAGVSGRSRRRFSSSARLTAAWMRNCRTSDCRSRSVSTPRPVTIALDSGARDPSGGLSARAPESKWREVHRPLEECGESAALAVNN